MNEPLSETQNKMISYFYIVFFGQSLSLFGSRLVQFTLVWWLTKISGSASVLAFASMMAILPQVLFGPFVGPLIDRWNRRIVLMVSDSFIASAIVILAIIYAQGKVEIWHIYTVMFIRSIGAAFQWPAKQASTSLMVPKRHLSRVSGLNQAVVGLVSFTAPPLGALLIELFPIPNILAIDVSTAIVAVGSLFFINIPQPQRSDELKSSFSSILSDFRDGFQYLWNWKGALIIVVIAMVINLLANPAFSLMPILVTRYFGGDAIEFAWMQSAVGIGTVLGGITLGVWGGFKERVKTGLMGLILSGISMIVIGFTPKDMFVLAVCAFFFIWIYEFHC